MGVKSAGNEASRAREAGPTGTGEGLGLRSGDGLGDGGLTDGLGDADGNGSTGEGIGDGLATGDGLGTGSGGVVLPVTVKLYRPRLP